MRAVSRLTASVLTAALLASCTGTGGDGGTPTTATKATPAAKAVDAPYASTYKP